jgi:hypothetical protein
MSAKPYTSGDLIRIVNTIPIPPLDPLRVIATYADPDNWEMVTCNQRGNWAWRGPVIVGYELAEWATAKSQIGAADADR